MVKRFTANFEFTPNIAFAPDTIEFTNTSTVGDVVLRDSVVFLDDNDNIIENFTPENIFVNKIERYLWSFGDNKISVDKSPKHYFDVSGTYGVSLSIISERIYDLSTNTYFRVRDTIIKNITLNLMSVKWLKSHMTIPHLKAYEESQGFRDLINSTSRIFDRMYNEIKNVADLMDIRHVPPQFLKYFSETFNHKNFYSSKVGYDNQDLTDTFESFFDYDIFDRIEQGIATENEINRFRQFIIDTSALFKQKGSPESIVNFFKLYNMFTSVKEMWTKNFGTTTPNSIIDYFILDPTLENSKNKFKFNSIKVSGWNNTLARFIGSVNELKIDNYHYTSLHSYPSDIIETSDECYSKFFINDVSPRVIGIQRRDGRPLSEETKKGCNTVDLFANCTEPIDTTCLIDGVDIQINNDFNIDKQFNFGASYKIWQAPSDYVSSVINVLGLIPSGPRERNESPSDESDDYLWADWKNGAKVPDEVVGVSKNAIRNPVFTGVLPRHNHISTATNPNLFSDLDINTSGDIFVVTRGFINIQKSGYYVFSMDVGNTGSIDDIENRNVALFSLSKTPLPNLESVKQTTVDEFEFSRISGSGQYSVIDNNVVINLPTKNTEYGLIEVRQNESIKDSDYVFMDPGYYPYEIKSTYGNLNVKKLKLYMTGFEEVTNPINSITSFVSFFPNQLITTNRLVTVDTKILDITSSEGKGILTIPNNILEVGDIIQVAYSHPTIERNGLSGILSTGNKYKDFEIDARFSPYSEKLFDGEMLQVIPRNSFQIIFRAINRNKDLYSTVDSYYAILYDGKNSEFSIAYVSYSSVIGDVSYRLLNLNSDFSNLDQRVFYKPLLDDKGHTFTLENDIYYDIKVIVSENKVSLYFKENAKFTSLVNNVETTTQQDILNYVDDEEYTLLFENIPLSQGDEQTIVVDAQGSVIDVDSKYNIIDEPGHYGFAIKSSSIKLNRFSINPLDKIDENLVETRDKWKEVKPKWLDSRDSTTLQANSYSLNDINKNESFRISALNNYNGETVIPINDNLSSINDNIVNRVFGDNIVADTWGTRFNVVFDRKFINERFETTEELLDAVFLPIGQFFEPTINMFRTGGGYEYGPAGFVPVISENTRILPHTISAKNNEVYEYPSHMSRSVNNKSIIYLDTKLNTFIKSNPENVVYNGIWEEVCPKSTSRMWNINGNDILNEVFAPIYRNRNDINSENEEVIGVRIVNNEAFDRLVCRYCEDSVLWGLFDITYPEGMNDNYPQYKNSVIVDGLVRYFIPIGKLEKGKFIHLVSPEMIKGSSKVNMLGVFSNHDYSGFTFASTNENVALSIDELNHWEHKHGQQLLCEYYIDVNVSLVAKFTQYNIIPFDIHEPKPCEPGAYPIQPDDLARDCLVSNIPNAFYLPSSIKNIIDRIDSGESDLTTFTEEYNWWMPTQVWGSDNITVRYPNDSNNIFSGLGSTNNGVDITLPKSSYPSPYLVDVEWCVTSSGWDHELATEDHNEYGFGIFDTSSYENIGFSLDESRFTLDSEEIITIAEKMKTLMYIGDVGDGNNSVRLGEIVNKDTDPNRTFIPVGLYNWYLSHASNENFLLDENSRIGWEVSDWNNEFVDCFKMNTVFYPINEGEYDINKYWAAYPGYELPVGSIVKVALDYSVAAENCDGDNAPTLAQKTVTVGVSDGKIMFFNVPALVEPYPRWKSIVKNVLVDNFNLPNDHYYISTNNNKAVLVFNTQQFDFNKFVGTTEFYIELFSDKLFDLVTTTTLIDNFNTTRDIPWIVCVSDQVKYKVATREPALELKYTGDTLPYSIIRYKNSDALKMTDVFEDKNYYGYTGTDDNKSTVGISDNGGSRIPMYLANIESNNYEFECEVIFDERITNSDYTKQFELILKAENNYSHPDKEWGITDYYFVGFGTYNFDIGMGMRSVDLTTNEIKETFLASWGEFNTRNIKAGVWYSIKAKVSTNEIKIFFNERGRDPQLVLNYNTNKKYEKLSERYLRGEWETLQSILVGLDELQVTYPNKLGNIVSSEYTFDNFKSEFASKLPVDGSYVGFKLFNPSTYVGNVKYNINTPKVYNFSTTIDGTSLNPLLVEIDNRFGIPNNAFINGYNKSFDFVEYVLIGDILYYKTDGMIPERYKNPVDKFYVVDDKTFIIEKEYPNDTGVGINYWEEGRHSIIWSIERGTDPYDIVRLPDFFRVVPNLSKVIVVRNGRANVAQLDNNGNVVGSKLTLRIGDLILFDIDCDINSIVSVSTTGSPETCNSTWALSGNILRYNIKLRVFDTRLIEEYPIMIKDKTFYKDSIMKYQDFVEKKLSEIHINDNKLNIVFEDIDNAD